MANLEVKDGQSVDFVVVKSEPIECDVDIKVEPPDTYNEYKEGTRIENVEDETKTSRETSQVENSNISVKEEYEASAFEHITVKVEPTCYSSDDDLDLASYSLAKIRQAADPHTKLNQKTQIRKKKDHDEDYTLKKKKKKVVNEIVKKPYTNKAKKQENCYSDNVTKHIELVTITEDERQIEFKDLVQARRHMRYFCEHCAIGFVMEEPFLVHMKSHAPESGEFKCEICCCRSNNKEQMYKHRLRHYRRYRCGICQRVFKDKETASSHVMSEHVHEAFICGECGKGFRRPAYLKKHVAQQHTRGQQLECPVCRRVFFHQSMFNTHFRRHNDEVRNPVKQLFICDLCSKQLKTKQALRRHLAVHERNRDVPCSLCPVKFHTKKGLRLHEVNKHSEEKERRMLQQCPQCERECTTPALLRQHIRRMHTDRTKKYQCDHCKRFYWSKGEIRSHIVWSHAPSRGKRALFCCGREFRTRSRLKDHVAIHHLGHERERIHKCDQCDKAFANKQVLNRHKKSHLDFTYPCPECGLRFKSEAYVKVHHQLKHLNMTRAEIKAIKQAKRALNNIQTDKHMVNYDGALNNTQTDKHTVNYDGGLYNAQTYKNTVNYDEPQDLSVRSDKISFETVLVKQEVVSDSEISVPLFDLAELKGRL